MALIIDIKIVPSSKHHRWILESSGRLKCFVVSVPEKGKANQELIASLAKVLHIPKQDVEIVSGHISPYKKIKIHADYTFDTLLQALGLDRQMTLS